MRIVFPFLLFCGFFEPAFAQNRYTDSLYKIVRDDQRTNPTKILALSQLAHTVRYYDKPEALSLAEKAVALANKEKDALFKVYAYESRSAVYLRMRNMESAHKSSDSSMIYAEQTGDVKAKSWAWYQKGRTLDFENKPKEALAAQLKALQYIKGKGYWKEEASIYYALYGVFSTWEDPENESKYALLALETAKKSHDPNNLCESWQAISSATANRFLKTKDTVFRDSAMAANKMAIRVYLQHEDYMRMMQLITIPCINIADAYNRHFPASPQTTDSLRRYALLAFDYAAKGKDTRLQATSFGLLNEDAKRNGNYKLAETYLLQALFLFESEPNPDYYVLSNIHRDLSELAERRKDYSKALEYYKAYTDNYRKDFDKEQSNAGKELEARFQAKEREQEIEFLTEKEAFQRKQKYLYIGIGIALLAGLVFMFRSYHFRLRYSQQREKILGQEKEEARLLAKLKEEESLLATSELQKAELRARLQEELAHVKEEEAARLHAEQQVVLTRNEMLQKEVMASNLHVEQKNKMLQDLKKRMNENPGKEIKIAELSKVLKQQQHFDNDFEVLKTELKEIHPEFYQRLQEKANNKLTSLDLRYCGYIYLKRSNLEMANLSGVEPKSVRMSKYRIKQKLGLQKEDDLDAFIGHV
jgi:hypothetical protein